MLLQELISRDALAGMRIGISVSDSDDLSRLGLSKAHAEIAVGEIARAILIAGGSLVYGGRIRPSGFTKYLMHEVSRYGRDQNALTLCLAAPEHRKLSYEELDIADRELDMKGRIVCLDEDGNSIGNVLSTKPVAPQLLDEDVAAHAYSSLRTYMGTITDARVLLGGNLGNFAGNAPGIIEEAVVAVKKRQPILVAAGFGGASALVSRHLQIDDLQWAPEDFPLRPKDKRIDAALTRLDEAVAAFNWVSTLAGLEPGELRQLSASHRASEIAALVVAGISRTRTSGG